MNFVTNNKLWIIGGIVGAVVYRTQMPEFDRISQTEFRHRINAAQIGCNEAATAYVMAHPIDASDVEQAIKPQCEIFDKLKQKYFDRFGATYPE